MSTETIAVLLLTLALHASVLLGLAWLVDRGEWLARRPAWREMLWRTALFGALLTTAAQFALGDHGFGARIALASAAPGETVTDAVVEVPSVVPAPVDIATIAKRNAAATKPATNPASHTSEHANAATDTATIRSPLPVADASTASTQSDRWSWPAWSSVLVAAWLAGVLLALARCVGMAWRLHGLTRNAERIEGGNVFHMAATLTAAACTRRVRLAIVPGLASPIVTPGRIVGLPKWALQLDTDCLRAMLAHEVAHVARRDPMCKLGVAFMRALLWFLPLTAVAARRLDECAELACDAWAARILGNGRALAECLAECLDRRDGGVEFAFVSAMAGRESPVLQRIDQLLGGIPMKPSKPGLRTGLAFTLLTIGALALPGVGFESAVAQDSHDVPAPNQELVAAGHPPTSLARVAGEGGTARGAGGGVRERLPSSPPPPAAPTPPSAPAPLSAPTPAPEVPPVPAVPAVPAIPAVPAVPATDDDGNLTHVSIHQDSSGVRHQSTTLELDDGSNAYKVSIKGKVAFTEREDNIATLSDGGTASFAQTHAGSTRRIDFRADDGAVTRRYFVNDREQPLDAAGRQWLAAMIPMVLRESGVNAAQRVQRFHARGGADAVLDEIDRIQSGYVRGLYVRELVALGKLSPAELTRTIAAIDGIDSDYERRTALSALADAQPLDPAQQELVIAQARKIGSDYERAELLTSMLPKLANVPEVTNAWIDAATGIGSDFESRRSLQALVTTTNLDDAALMRVLAAAASIGSDFESRTLLVAILGRASDVNAFAPAYSEAVAELSSDYEQREALLALIRQGTLDTRGAGVALEAAADIDSDYECREVLTALARVMPDDATLLARYRAIAQRLSDYERGEAERALARFAQR